MADPVRDRPGPVVGRRSGRVPFLDALELETIVWLPEGHLTQLPDPSADRWQDA